ncbi:MAG: hypothetical protein AAF716_19670 [Cyanobacteria bacterium P01_D01_bin.1]
MIRDEASFPKEDMKSLLSNIGLPVYEISKSHWIIEMSHRHVKYGAEIIENSQWISCSALLVGLDKMPENQKICRFILELNARLNAAYVALQEDKLMLVKVTSTEDFREYNLYRDLTSFHVTHEYVYEQLLNTAEEMNIQFKF